MKRFEKSLLCRHKRQNRSEHNRQKPNFCLKIKNNYYVCVWSGLLQENKLIVVSFCKSGMFPKVFFYFFCFVCFFVFLVKTLLCFPERHIFSLFMGLNSFAFLLICPFIYLSVLVLIHSLSCWNSTTPVLQ